MVGHGHRREIYQHRADHFASVQRRYAARERVVVHVRVATFLAAAVMFILGRNDPAGLAWYIGSGAAWPDSSPRLAYHEHVGRQMRRFRRPPPHQHRGARPRRIAIGPHCPRPPSIIPPQCQAVADDLDLFGHASLFQLLSAANTPIGIETLRDWLLEGAAAGEIRQRQEAAADSRRTWNCGKRSTSKGGCLPTAAAPSPASWNGLKSRPGSVRGRDCCGCSEPCRPRWSCWLRRSPQIGCRWNAVRSPFSSPWYSTLSPRPSWAGGSKSTFSRINLRYNETARYARMFRLMYAMPDANFAIESRQTGCRGAWRGRAAALGRLQNIVALARIRHSPMLFIFIYLPLQIVFLYDFHMLCLLEAWQKQFGGYTRAWFRALGKLEALSSLAMLAHDNPGWTMPEIDESAKCFRARGLGHPLLPDRSRVANDVELGPPGTFLLVTGSNMSGKSTLLRAMGVNAILAQAGAPVCAGHLAMPPLVLATSMRVRDSLEGGVSFYMAELLRLKQHCGPGSQCRVAKGPIAILPPGRDPSGDQLEGAAYRRGAGHGAPARMRHDRGHLDP